MRHILIPLFLAGAVAVAAESITAAPAMPTQTVVDLFLGAKRKSNYTFVGSVLEADDAATTYHITCKSGDLNLPGFPTTTCDLKDPPWTVTEGSSTMVASLLTSIGSVTALLDETCVLEDRTAAYCNYTFIGNSGPQSTSTSYTTVITGDLYYEYPIAITAGAEKLAAATGLPSDSGARSIGANTGGMLGAAIVVVAAFATWQIV
ncbi:hypothetical protein F5Y14DRAFT_418014 [Nemania sp. NC0429]|nr:hypothetical protein F5Y14DRAFT_418014 [Nemania sp. NC0429]